MDCFLPRSITLYGANGAQSELVSRILAAVDYGFFTMIPLLAQYFAECFVRGYFGYADNHSVWTTLVDRDILHRT